MNEFRLDIISYMESVKGRRWASSSLVDYQIKKLHPGKEAASVIGTQQNGRKIGGVVYVDPDTKKYTHQIVQ